MSSKYDLHYQFLTNNLKTIVSFKDRFPNRSLQSSNQIMIFDDNTSRLFGKNVTNSIIIKDRDSAKCWNSIEDIFTIAVKRGLDRKAEIIGIGGGAVCDVAGFAAALYLRGIKLTLIPTTVTAMVDASFGGKTGINYKNSKNIIGVFKPADNIFIVPSVVKYLTGEDYLAGLAEVIKTALLGDTELVNILEKERDAVINRDLQLVKTYVHRCIKVKARFVTGDMQEEISDQNTVGGISRSYLNFGHTFAHALESVSGFTWSHGKAVAWGILRALRLGELIGITDKSYVIRVKDLLRQYGYEITANYDPDKLLAAMRNDKKRVGTNLFFILQSSIGKTQLRSVPENLVRQSLIEDMKSADKNP